MFRLRLERAASLDMFLVVRTTKKKEGKDFDFLYLFCLFLSAFVCHNSCLLRCASQNSLDESSQKIPRQKSTAGTYKNDAHTNRSFDAMNEMRK